MNEQQKSNNTIKKDCAAVAQVEQMVMLRIASALERIADSLEAAKEDTQQVEVEMEPDLSLQITLEFMDGARYSELSKKYGRNASCIRERVLRLLRKRNKKLYESGINVDGTNNYLTPPAKFIRANRKGFGF